MAAERYWRRAVVAIYVGQRLDAPGQADPTVHRASDRGPGSDLGPRVICLGDPNSATADVVRATGKQVGAAVRSRRTAPVSEDPAVRPLHQVQRADRATGGAALIERDSPVGPTTCLLFR